MNKINMILAAIAGMSPYYQEIGAKIKHEKREKLCLNCGNTHAHNNSFCSAKCCKEHRK